MDRRTAVRAMLASGPAILVAGADAAFAAEAKPVPRIAYHLADLEKAGFVLGICAIISTAWAVPTA